MKTGFTLSEILITLVIIGFIGALGVPMLGSQKLKKPMEIKSRHGTMECFWENDRLMQFQANNTENKDGELKDVTDEGASYVSKLVCFASSRSWRRRCCRAFRAAPLHTVKG